MSEPRLPFLITSPIADGFVGSPTTQKSGTLPDASSHSTILIVPLIAAASSSPVIIRLILPASLSVARYDLQAPTKAAIPPFISAAPRP